MSAESVSIVNPVHLATFKSLVSSSVGTVTLSTAERSLLEVHGGRRRAGKLALVSLKCVIFAGQKQRLLLRWLGCVRWNISSSSFHV